MVISEEQLFDLLSGSGYLSLQKLKDAKETVTSEKVSLYDALVEKDFISDENLGKIIAEFLKLPFISLEKVFIQQEVLRIIPEDLARRKKIIAFGQETSGLKIAAAHPEDTVTIQFLAQKIGQPIQVYYATERDITNAMHFYKKDLQEQFDKLLKEQVQIANTSASKEAPITKIVDLLIEYAYFNKASDIHLEPRSTNSLTRFRIDGVLHDVLFLRSEEHTSELQSPDHLVCRLLLEKKKTRRYTSVPPTMRPVLN